MVTGELKKNKNLVTVKIIKKTKHGYARNSKQKYGYDTYSQDMG